MEKQISAVEWFNQEIKELFNKHQDGEISGSIFHFERLVALTKAKQMEKEQIIKARQDIFHTGNLTAEQYYNETFKSE